MLQFTAKKWLATVYFHYKIMWARAAVCSSGVENAGFQSRCRDLGVGEQSHFDHRPRGRYVSVSLPRFGGWRAEHRASHRRPCIQVSVSLPRFGGWRAIASQIELDMAAGFQSRCRDLGVGESMATSMASITPLFQSRCRDLGVGESQ